MSHISDPGPRATEIAALFDAVFTASEGAGEGRRIGTLARQLIDTTPPPDLCVFAAEDAGRLTGAILFTRLRYDDPRQVFLLAPVAVATDCQGRGIGQALIADGLAHMRRFGADGILTYGDPAFYGRVGFVPITQARAPAPFVLSMPEGWQAQALGPAPLDRLNGPCTCVVPFRDPALW